MAGETRNLGQVSGVFIGTTPPENTTLIWFDSTPSQRCHKVYDPSLNTWVILNQGIISSITYSELESIATGVGLSVGKFYQIRDRGNALAVAITSTKIQYADSLGNILIDDLGTNIQYHVTSSNLLIDDVAGVFDSVNKKLVFQFNQETPDFNEDFLMGKAKRSNIWKLVKYKISSFLSTVSGNSITWNNGFFFNFASAFNSKLDVAGGAVAKDTYDVDQAQIAQDIENVASENQQIVANANAAIANATSNTAIYGKRLPSISTAGEPVDIAAGDTLNTLISKIQRFINRFKFATGVRISQDFTDNVPTALVNNNDTVDSAIRKLQHMIKNGGSVTTLSDNWEPLPYDQTVPDVAAGDSLDEAFAKAQGKFNQLGILTNELIKSREKASIPAPEEQWPSKVEFNIRTGSLYFRHNYDASISDEGDEEVNISSANGLSTSDSAGRFASLRAKKGLGISSYSYRVNKINGEEYGDKYVAAAASISAVARQRGTYDIGIVAGLTANASGSIGNANVFDAYFPRLKVSELFLGQVELEDGDYDNNEYYIDDSSKCTFFDLHNSTGNPVTIYLPTAPKRGHILLFRRGNGKFVIDSNGALFDQIIGYKYLDNDHDFAIGDVLMLVFQPWNRDGSAGAFTGHWLPCQLKKFSTL